MLGAADIPARVAAARALDKAAIAQLVTLFEDRRKQAAELRAEVQRELDRTPRDHRCTILGITGSPGSGKSSLVSRLAPALLDLAPELSVAVVAVDPSSPISGGSLLGDRTRMQESRERERLYFRSQASDKELGGLGPHSFQVCRLLTELFDAVILETVGVGQSEADVRQIADRVYLVLAPLAGDEVQLLKAGIIEIPDAFIVNKCDEPASERTLVQLRSSLWLARPFDAETVPIHRTSARTGEGLAPLAESIVEYVRSGEPRSAAERTRYFFERWVRQEYGRAGNTFLQRQAGGASSYLEARGGIDRAQLGFPHEFASFLNSQTASSSGEEFETDSTSPPRKTKKAVHGGRGS